MTLYKYSEASCDEQRSTYASEPFLEILSIVVLIL